MTGSDSIVRLVTARKGDPYATLSRRVFGSRPFWPQAVGPVLCAVAAAVLGLPALQFALLVLVPTPLALGLLVIRRRPLWPAEDVLMWLNMASMDEWRHSLGVPMPRNPGQAERWLAGHPAGPEADAVRPAMLLLAGRLSEARSAVASLPTESARERHRRFDFELALDAKAGLPLDTTAADDAIRADTEIPQVEMDLHLAYHAALLATDRGLDGVPFLVAARRDAGPLPAPYARRIWLARFWSVIGALLVGVWVLAAVLVGAATSGGVVWF